MINAVFRRRVLPAAGLATCLFLLAPLSVRAADAPKKITSIEGITEYHLDNGLRILLFPDVSAPTVTVNLTVMVGSRQEGRGEHGMAHLLEHMVFKGTPNHPDVPKSLRDHGANFNGTTSYDRTNYFETMPATDANLEFGIALEADRMVNSLIRKEDLASEFSVVRSEFESGENNPERILQQRMMSAAYEWHNYGKTVIGNRSDIERVPVENLRRFYARYYQPDNALLVIAGKFEPAKALELIAKHFGPLTKPERKLDETYTEEPAQDGERHVILRRVGKVGVVGAVYHIPSGVHADYAALEVLGEVLDAEPTGRLYKALVETKKAATAGVGALGLHDPGLFLAIVTVDKDASTDAARDIMLDTMEKLGAGEFTEEEVERAKRKLLKDRELLMTQSGRVGITLSEWGAKGDWRLFFLHRDRLAKVTPADLKRVAAAYLQRNNRTAGTFIPADAPQRATIPATPDPVALVNDYKGGATIAEGESFEPTPANIEARVKHGTLSCGLKTALLAKKTRGEMAVVKINLRYGNEEALNGKTTAATFLNEMLERGTKKHPRKELQDELDKLGARVNIAGQPGLLAVTLQVKRPNLPAALTLVGEMLREPAFPADEFDTLKRQSLEQLRKGLPEPQARASNAVQRHLSPFPADNIRYVPTLEELLARYEAVTLDQVKALYAEQLSSAHGELVMVGDFDAASAPKQVDDLLAGWKSAVPYRRIPQPAKEDLSGGKLVIETPDKANAVFVAAHAFPMLDSDADYAAAKVADYLFGEAALASRLSNRVRGKDGLSYAVGAQFNASPVDKAGTFVMFAICNPKNITKVDKAIAEELEKMLKDGPTEKELNETKAAYLEQLKGGRATDAQLATTLGNNLFVGRTFEYQAELEKRIAALTVKDAAEAFRKHVNAGKLFIVWAGDFKKAAEDEKKDEKK